MSQSSSAKADAVSMGISFAAGAIWVVYALTGAPGWLLIVGVLFSMFTGWWWAFGRRAAFPDGIADADDDGSRGRHRNRDRRR